MSGRQGRSNNLAPGDVRSPMPMRTDKHDISLIVAYLDGDLSPREAEAFEAHRDACPRCAQQLADSARTRAIARHLAGSKLPADMWPGVSAGIRRAARWDRLIAFLRGPALAIAATAAIGLVSVVPFRSPVDAPIPIYDDTGPESDGWMEVVEYLQATPAVHGDPMQSDGG